MYHYQEDSDTQKDQQYLGLGNSDDIGGLNGSPFRDLVRQGTIKSRDRNGILRIPLHSIFDVAKTPVWDTNKYGRTDIKLEMAFDKMNVRQTMGQNDANWANFNYQDIDAPNAGIAFPANTTVTTFKSSNAYFHPERKMPFHVNQKLIFQYTATNAGTPTVFSIANGTQKERTISQIQHNVDNDNKVSISFVDGIAFLQDDVISAMTVVGADSASSTIVFNKIELEMKQVNDPTPSSIEYTTYSTEEDSGFVGTQTNINKQYTCEGDSDNLVICALGSNAGVVKQNPTIRVNSSRITIDSKEETPQAVVGLVVGGINQAQPLYYDRIDRAFLNMGEDVESLYEKQYNFNQGLPTNPAGEASTLFQPLPLKPGTKQVQLDLDYTAGEIHTLKLYKRMVKQI